MNDDGPLHPADQDLLSAWKAFAQLRSAGDHDAAATSARSTAFALRREGADDSHPAVLTFDTLGLAARNASEFDEPEPPSGASDTLRSVWAVTWEPAHISGLTAVDGLPGVGKSTLLYGLAAALPIAPEVAVLRRRGSAMDGSTLDESRRIASGFLADEVARIAGLPALVLDRSWLSHLAYAWAFEATAGQPGLYRSVYDRTDRLLSDGLLQRPLRSVLLERSAEPSARRTPSGFSALPDFYSEPNFKRLWTEWWSLLEASGAHLDRLSVDPDPVRAARDLLVVVSATPSSHLRDYALPPPR
jgi:hypothetical protein